MSFKTGNQYNFRADKVILRDNETRESVGNLNKIEIRYNTRRNEPTYNSMKSLYNLRATFGYRLGGVIRQAIVQVHDIKRHALNAVNFGRAFFGTIGDRLGFDVKTTLDDYTRLYSTRDIIANLKRERNGGEITEKIKHMKYQKFSDFSEYTHDKASTHDYSVRKLVVDGISALATGTVDKAKRLEKNGYDTYLDRQEKAGNLNPKSFKEWRKTGDDGKDDHKPMSHKAIMESAAAERRNSGPLAALRRFVTGNLHLDQISTLLDKVKFRTSLRLENGARFFSELSGMLKNGIDNPLREAHSRMVERRKEGTEAYREHFALDYEKMTNRKKIEFDSPIDFSKKPDVTSDDVAGTDPSNGTRDSRLGDDDIIVTKDKGDVPVSPGKREDDIEVLPTLRDVLMNIRFDKSGEELAIPQNKDKTPKEGK